jgi:hypothetical protein
MVILLTAAGLLGLAAVLNDRFHQEVVVSPETHSQLANFIWNICNLLLGPSDQGGFE